MILPWASSFPPTKSHRNPFSRFGIILLKFRQINKHMTNNIILLEGVMMLYHLTEGAFNVKVRWQPQPSWIKPHLISALNPVLPSKDWTVGRFGAVLSVAGPSATAKTKSLVFGLTHNTHKHMHLSGTKFFQLLNQMLPPQSSVWNTLQPFSQILRESVLISVSCENVYKCYLLWMRGKKYHKLLALVHPNEEWLKQLWSRVSLWVKLATIKKTGRNEWSQRGRASQG